MALKMETVATTAFAGQKPGTSGLRKKVKEFMTPNYMENFIQCTLEAVGPSLKGSTLVVGGDGRYGVTHATDLIIKMAAGNGVMALCHSEIWAVLGFIFIIREFRKVLYQ